MPFHKKLYAMGWLPDHPSPRDYTPGHDKVSDQHKRLGQKQSVKGMLKTLGLAKGGKQPSLPAKVDLSKWCSPIEDQQDIGSCTAQAGAGLVEYFENRAFGLHLDASRLFLYKVTRNLMNVTGDTGAYLRTTMQAMVMFGLPLEQYWPYHTADYEKEPSAFCYAMAQNFQAISYFRLDPNGTTPAQLLATLKKHLATGLPAMFGFSVFNSISQAKDDGLVPYPLPQDRLVGGHAVVAIGYDDKLSLPGPDGKPTKGGVMFRNSWGTGWGQEGYGWLCYEYLLSGLTRDWWSLLKNEWVETGKFK